VNAVLIIPLRAQDSPELSGCLGCCGFDCVRTRFRLPSSAFAQASAAVSDTWVLRKTYACAVGRVYVNLRCVSVKSELVSV
jgi:hypothetical protein